MRIFPSSRIAFGTFLFLLAAGLGAQNLHWKLYNNPNEGFSASFPSLPDVQKKSFETAGGTFELRTYSASAGDSTMMVGVCDYGPIVAQKRAQEVLLGAKNSALANLSSRLASERHISLGKNEGIEFEAVSDSTRYSARMYLVETTLYELLVASPLGHPSDQTKRFLDSFQLVNRTKDNSGE